MGGSSSFGSGPKDEHSMMSSVEYNVVADGTGRNEDANAMTALGVEVKERFRDMRTAFLKMDQNHDGRISKKELLDLCRQWNIPQSEAQRVIRAADLDHNGTLDFAEFAQRFDPFEGSLQDDAFYSTGVSQTTAVHDRPIKCGGGNGWDIGDADQTSMPSKRWSEMEQDNHRASGAPIHAARALQGQDGSGSPGKSLKNSDTVQEWQAKCAMLEARNAELEKEVATCRARISELEDKLIATIDATRPQAQPQPAAQPQAAPPPQVASPVPRSREVEEEEEDDPTAVFVYGQSGCAKTAAVCKALHSASIPFQTRDMNQDKRYLKAVKACCGTAATPPAPVVVRGLKAWWDDGNASQGDGMFAFGFPETVAMELRHLIGCLDGPTVSVPVRMDADIDTEIAERFLSMQQAFLKMDANQDGRISKKELLTKCREWNIPTSEAERVVQEADLDMNGTLDFNEFAKRFNSAIPTRPKTGSRPSSRGPPERPSSRGPKRTSFASDTKGGR